jgi:hypothetical protein
MRRIILRADGSAPLRRSNGYVQQSRDRVLLGITVCLLAGVVWVLSASVAFLGATYNGAEKRCFDGGPWSSEMFSPEAGPVSAGFSWWPVGRECEWRTTASGETVIVRNESWGATYALFALGVISASGLVIAAIPTRRRDGPGED